MGSTDRHVAGLEKEVKRLSDALLKAQATNQKLEMDKDEAWRLLQFMVKKQGGSYGIVIPELNRFDASKHQLQFRSNPDATLTLTLDKKP